ncbi:hypothetical protein BGLY_0977 [Bacillus glycinifermentans]|nr:hypothetical protein BGLY_0977 [Bacillus glycinifermentans]
MKTLIMMGVILTFLVSIFTAGYESKPGKKH